MPKCTDGTMELRRLGRRVVEANFEGGDISSDGGLLDPAQPSREAALDAWKKIALALANSESREDQVLATEIVEFVRDKPIRRR